MSDSSIDRAEFSGFVPNRSARSRRFVLLAALLPLTCLVLLGVSALRSGRASALTSCGLSPPPVDVTRLGTITARVRVQQPDQLVFQFGQRRETSSQDMPAEFIDEPTLLDPAVRPVDGELLAIRPPRLVETTTHSQIPSDKIFVRATFRASQKAVSFEICLDLRDSRGFGPGSYEGVAALTDPRFVEVQVPVKVTLKSGGWMLPLLAALVGGALGAAWGTVSPVVATYEKTGTTRTVRGQARRLLVIAIVLGVCGGVWAYLQKYVDIPTFRGVTRDWVAVGTASFLGAATLYPVAALLETWMRISGHSEQVQGGEGGPGLDHPHDVKKAEAE
jgi:hypothetical protein